MAEGDRRLAAVMFTDIEGYTALAQRSESIALKLLHEHRELIRPIIVRHAGREVKTMGDAFLIEFDSALDATECAVDMQEALRKFNADNAEKFLMRIGTHIGDVIHRGNDLYGDAVNIASRIEAFARGGEICISEETYSQIRNKVPFGFASLGRQTLKNVAYPVAIYRLDVPKGAPVPPTVRGRTMEQEIRFCTSADGVRLAYAVLGDRSKLSFVRVGTWLTHLEFDWHSPIWRHWLEEMGRIFFFVRYDPRGCGLSDWEVKDISFDAWVRDLETVVDAVGLQKFVLFGMSQGGAIGIEYALRHPERVSQLILCGGYARGWMNRGRANLEERNAVMTLTRQGWGRDNPAYRQIFTTLFVPEANPEQMRWFNELQLKSMSPENAARFQAETGKIDIVKKLPSVSVPTLVLHGREDAVVPFEEGRLIAASIPGARFVALESRNHILLEPEPAWQRFLHEVRTFTRTTNPVAATA